MLNINDNLNLNVFEEEQVYTLQENSSDILMSFYSVNPKNNFQNHLRKSQNNPEIIEFLNLLNFSYFETHSYSLDIEFSQKLNTYIDNNFVLFNNNFVPSWPNAPSFSVRTKCINPTKLPNFSLNKLPFSASPIISLNEKLISLFL